MWQLGGLWVLGMLDGADGCRMEEEEGLGVAVAAGVRPVCPGKVGFSI